MTSRNSMSASGALPETWTPEAVYLIRYATRPSAVRGEHFYGFDACGTDSMPIDYFVWLVTGGSHAILIDAGFTPETASKRPGRIHLGSPLEVAEALGYPPEAITDLVITHLHYDHTGYASQLPQARVHVQEQELAFWTGRHAHRGPYQHIVEIDDIVHFVRVNHEGRVHQSNGVDTIVPGVAAHLVGGHTPGMQVVTVTLDDDSTVVLASDASHFKENIETDRPFSIAHHVPDMFDAFEEVRRLSITRSGKTGIIVAGHDPVAREEFTPALTNDPRFDGRVWRIA
ncbi:MBL fold hydrolase [Leucobacter sp. Psy1]|uniref:N-acyl homoserine lactonase family protein n=1 Tax=Leucobacter sp. Psy1 TaxID=2875729 RepID=UPI001CD6A8A8|nr:N-acyl homoserine lactonase family protein [Leucobacter sp. Psy1]UBH07419.1 MBL fold hydrolase [Leucobacter sp. Psy1]